jgi:hypothetical protein
MEEVLTYTDAARELEVARPTISKWVREGKLTQGVRLGKAKTVTSESVEKLKGDGVFLQGVRIAQKGQMKLTEGTIKKNSEELGKEILHRLSVLEITISDIKEMLRNNTQQTEQTNQDIRQTTKDKDESRDIDFTDPKKVATTLKENFEKDQLRIIVSLLRETLGPAEKKKKLQAKKSFSQLKRNKKSEAKPKRNKKPATQPFAANFTAEPPETLSKGAQKEVKVKAL